MFLRAREEGCGFCWGVWDCSEALLLLVGKFNPSILRGRNWCECWRWWDGILRSSGRATGIWSEDEIGVVAVREPELDPRIEAWG